MERKQMEMAPMPNTKIETSESQYEGGGNPTPVFAMVPNDVCCLFKPPCGINKQKEFQGIPG